jgi:hypothetical protein
VSSLYIFDALSRAARQQVTKLGLTGSLYSEKGNCATFLVKIEGVLEGLFQDMVTIGTEESKVSRRIHSPIIQSCRMDLSFAASFMSLSPATQQDIGSAGCSLSLCWHARLPAVYIYETNLSNNCLLAGKITKNS